MYSLLQEYGDSNPEKFNEKLIYLKSHDNVLEHINSIFNALEVINGITFLGSELITDESKFPKWENKDGTINVNVEESRYVLIKFKFLLSDGVESKEIEKCLFFPKLIDKTYFILNGNKFFPIYQIIDNATYNNGKNLTLKTLLMPVVLMQKPSEFKDFTTGEIIEGNVKQINLFKHKLNYLLYFFAEKGFRDTMNFMFRGSDWEDNIIFKDKEDDKTWISSQKKSQEYRIFKLQTRGNTMLCIKKDYMNKNFDKCINLIDGLLQTDYKNVYDPKYWIITLGSIFSRNKNSYESKAFDILISFKRILDSSTKKALRLKNDNKEDIFHLIRWMVESFDDLIKRDNMDLKYKRMRVNEYLCYNLLRKMSNATYRLLNKSEIDMKDREQVFSTLGPMYIIKSILNNELLRYFGGVNAIELFNPLLKGSFKGYQGLGEGSNKIIPDIYRGLHPSYIGYFGLSASSAGDPGMTVTQCPMSPVENFYFSEEPLD